MTVLLRCSTIRCILSSVRSVIRLGQSGQSPVSFIIFHYTNSAVVSYRFGSDQVPESFVALGIGGEPGDLAADVGFRMLRGPTAGAEEWPIVTGRTGTTFCYHRPIPL